MTATLAVDGPVPVLRPRSDRLDYLDATRAFALVLGVVFHASLSFLPTFIGWAVQDVSTGASIGPFVTVIHAFRLEVFFLLAGFFGRRTFHRGGAGAFVGSRVRRIVVPFVLGWFLLRPALGAEWAIGFASMRGDADVGVGLAAAGDSLNALPVGLFTGTHLWFLYYLVLITALTLVGRIMFKVIAGGRVKPWARGIDRGVAWLARSRWGLPVLAGPTAGALWPMRGWGVDTPDGSMQPHLPVLLIYGGFFAFGWLLGRQPAAMAEVARLTLTRGVTAALGLVGVVGLSGFQADPGHPHFGAAHVAFVVSYAWLMWSLVFLLIGGFKVCFQRPRGWVRYVADSSYWMYLIHLPIVVGLQIAIAEVSVHWSLKLGFISVVTIGVALASYDLMVRSTCVGALLNGRRRERVLGPWLWTFVAPAVGPGRLG